MLDLKTIIFITILLLFNSCATKKTSSVDSHFLHSLIKYTHNLKNQKPSKIQIKNYLINKYGQQWPIVSLNYLACNPKLPKTNIDTVIYFNTGTITPTDFNHSAKYRLIETLRIYKKYRPLRVILAGNNQPGASKTAAKDFLVSIGVQKKDIILESQSNTTWSNIKKTSLILKKNKSKKVHFVASAYHMERILRYFEKQFPKNELNIEISWSYYEPYLDTKSKLEDQVLHEVFSIPRDHIEYGNRFKSNLCSKNKSTKKKNSF